MRATRRLLYVLTLGLLLSSAGAIWFQESDEAAAGPDHPIVQVPPPPPSTTTVPTTVPAPTTTIPPPPRPARVPTNPYANEPLVEIGSIEIPKIGLNHRVFRGISLRTIDHGPSHWPGTAVPGQVGNAVFAGHRVTHSKPFRNIDQLVPGDEVIFTVDNVRSTYLVTGSEVVTPKALHIVDQTQTPTATLFACHPPGSARFRYVVHLALRI
jgi:sortase A